MGTTYPIDRASGPARTMVGKPFPNVTVQVLDSNQNPVPLGVVGEICFGGAGVVSGYLDRPELTAEKFIAREGHRIYRTGDMGRMHPDGYLEILGRRDFQVQLRGIRIELAGIESMVLELGLAAQCAVVAVPRNGDMRLVAFIVKPRNERIATFRRALAMELPDYMLPHQVVVLDAMPLTVNGKVDRTRLMQMEWTGQDRTDRHSLPATERERKVAQVVAEVLGLQEVGAEEDFFELGGDSLLGAIALMEIERVVGTDIPPTVLFKDRTVRALANYRPGVRTDATMPILLNEEAPGPPLFMLSGVHIYQRLADYLSGYCAAYGVFTQQEFRTFDPVRDFQPIESLAQDYIGIIRSRQARGPYRLLGYSFAGVVAYEVARQLRAAGDEVSFLGLIDAHLPEWSAGWKHKLAMLGRLRVGNMRAVAAFVARKIKERFKPATSSGAVVYYDDKELGQWETQRGVASYNAVTQYRSMIRPSKDRALIVTSGARLGEHPLHSRSCGWSPYIPHIDLHMIPADHFQMMRDDPHVATIADLIKRHLANG